MSFPKHLKGESLKKFLGGRKRYNSQRRRLAAIRQGLVLFLMENHPTWRQADLARYLGVSRSTISRDVLRIRTAEHTRRHPPHCPLCKGHGTLDMGAVMERRAKIISEIDPVALMG